MDKRRSQQVINSDSLTQSFCRPPYNQWACVNPCTWRGHNLFLSKIRRQSDLWIIGLLLRRTLPIICVSVFLPLVSFLFIRTSQYASSISSSPSLTYSYSHSHSHSHSHSLTLPLPLPLPRTRPLLLPPRVHALPACAFSPLPPFDAACVLLTVSVSLCQAGFISL